VNCALCEAAEILRDVFLPTFIRGLRVLASTANSAVDRAIRKVSGASNPYANGCKTPHTKTVKTAEKKEKEINKQKVCVNILQETGCV